MAGFVDWLGRAFGTNSNPVVVTISSGGGGGLVPLGDFQGTVTGSSKDVPTLIGTAIPSGATMMSFDVEGGAIRYRDDNTAPTTTVGRRVGQDASMDFTGDITKFKVIAESGSPKMNISFFG